jgi:Mrp family chromosome partitioning ATPase
MERLIGGVRTQAELESQTGLYGLGFVPIAPRNLRQAIKRQRAQSYFESVNIVSDLLRFGSDRYRAKVVLVTSAAPAEGKTVFAASLAASVGVTGGTALLIDCDLRRPSIARVLRLSSGSEPDGESAVVRRDEIQGVDVVTFRFPRDATQTSFFGSVRHFVDSARDRYDLIVLDAPPVLPFPDASKMALVADGTIMVVRWRHTPPALVVSAMRALMAYGGAIIGGVVTQVEETHLEPGDGANGRFYRHYAPFVR